MKGGRMHPRKVYTFLFTEDLKAAEDWYTRLFGRGPDNRPMPTLTQWEFRDFGGIGVCSDAEIAARGAVFLIVEDIAAERSRLRDLGIRLGDDIPGDYSTLAQVHDPDGNLITLASPPTRPYPPA